MRLAAKAAKKEIQLAARTSMRLPIQMFRWAHVPSVPLDGPVTYQVSAMFWNGNKPPIAKATTRATIAAHRATRGTFLNVGFTRGFASSQAYERSGRSCRRSASRSSILTRRPSRATAGPRARQ